LLAAPLVTKDDDGWDAALQVQNPGSTQITFVTTFLDESGATIYRVEEALAPGAVRTFYPPAMPEIPSGFRGSALLQTSSATGLTAIVNEATR
jgi:hypothetical protein